MTANGWNVSFWSNKNALEVDNGDCAQLCEYTKSTELYSVKVWILGDVNYIRKGGGAGGGGSGGHSTSI